MQFFALFFAKIKWINITLNPTLMRMPALALWHSSPLKPRYQQDLWYTAAMTRTNPAPACVTSSMAAYSLAARVAPWCLLVALALVSTQVGHAHGADQDAHTHLHLPTVNSSRGSLKYMSSYGLGLWNLAAFANSSHGQWATHLLEGLYSDQVHSLPLGFSFWSDLVLSFFGLASPSRHTPSCSVLEYPKRCLHKALSVGRA